MSMIWDFSPDVPEDGEIFNMRNNSAKKWATAYIGDVKKSLASKKPRISSRSITPVISDDAEVHVAWSAIENKLK